MEAKSLTLILEKATVMPQVGDIIRMCQMDLFQTFNSSLGIRSNLTPPAAESTQVSQPVVQDTYQRDEERGAIRGTPFSVVLSLIHLISGLGGGVSDTSFTYEKPCLFIQDIKVITVQLKKITV